MGEPLDITGGCHSEVDDVHVLRNSNKIIALDFSTGENCGGFTVWLWAMKDKGALPALYYGSHEGLHPQACRCHLLL